MPTGAATIVSIGKDIATGAGLTFALIGLGNICTGFAASPWLNAIPIGNINKVSLVGAAVWVLLRCRFTH